MSDTSQRLFIGTQTAPQVVFQRGAGELLDEMREFCRINTVLVFFHTYTSFQYRRDYNYDPETGKTLTDLWVRSDEKFYRNTPLRVPQQPDALYSERDVVDELLEAAAERDMRIFARSLEPYGIGRFMDHSPKVSEVDVHGRISKHLCFNHPDYVEWVLSTHEDLLRLHPGLHGLKYGQERGGPLLLGIEGQPVTCFCEHCRRKAHARGINMDRAQAGWLELMKIAQDRQAGEARPADGWFATILRVFMQYPDTLAHNQFYYDCREEHRKLIYGLSKNINPNLQVGWHLDHHFCWDLISRAAVDYAKFPEYSDWLSVALYFDAAGSRMAGHFQRTMADGFLADLPTDKALEAFRYMCGQDPEKEPGLEAMKKQAPLSADHVYRETRRVVEKIQGRSKVYGRVGFDIPMYPDANIQPDQVKDAVRATFEAGADGLFVAREYPEATEKNLRALGETIDALQAEGKVPAP